VANVDQREGNLLHLRLIDPSDPNAADDPMACLNADLVREGMSLAFAVPCAGRSDTFQALQRSTSLAGMLRRTLKSSRNSSRLQKEPRGIVWVSLSESGWDREV
jgi:hypothetical protein